MAASFENKNFDDDCNSNTDDKKKSVRERTEISKFEESENVSMAEEDLVAGLYTTNEVSSSSVTNKTKVTAKDKKRKAESNEDVSTTKIDIKTKTTKKMPPNSEVKKSKSASLAKKKLFACPSTAHEVTRRKVTDKRARKAAMHPPVSEMVLESLKILKKRNGATSQQISAHIGENYQANLKMLKSHINRFLRKAEDSGVIEKIIGANAEEKFKFKKADNTAAKAKQALILKKRKVELLKKTHVKKKQRKM